jgi:hypothetical protein
MSKTSDLYAQGVRDIRKTLEKYEGPDVDRMRADAELLHEEFEAWHTAPPGAVERRIAINKLFALYKQAIDYVASVKK